MSLFRFKRVPPGVSSTPFSEFIRTASSEEKKKVYSKVLKRASEVATADYPSRLAVRGLVGRSPV